MGIFQELNARWPLAGVTVDLLLDSGAFGYADVAKATSRRSESALELERKGIEVTRWSE